MQPLRPFIVVVWTGNAEAFVEDAAEAFERDVDGVKAKALLGRGAVFGVEMKAGTVGRTGDVVRLHFGEDAQWLAFPAPHGWEASSMNRFPEWLGYHRERLVKPEAAPRDD